MLLYFGRDVAVVKKITGGLMVRVLLSGAGTMCCAFGEDTLFSQCLSQSR